MQTQCSPYQAVTGKIYRLKQQRHAPVAQLVEHLAVTRGHEFDSGWTNTQGLKIT